MSTLSITRAAFGMLLLSAALSNQAQARPSDPTWRPGLTIPMVESQQAASATPQRWYGPRGTIPSPAVHSVEPATPIRPVRWIGPRGTIAVSK